MKDRILFGIGRVMVPVPRAVLQHLLEHREQAESGALDFMSDDHHRVRNFVVMALPKHGQPLSPEAIGEHLNLPIERVNTILDELERNMIFVYRKGGRSVVWAYPVTVDTTPHRVSYSSGEQGYAAWAIDAIATPFVQGQLRHEPLSVTVTTECAHCGKPLHLELDSDLNYRVTDEGADPVLFVPLVDFDKLTDPSIIDAFWMNSVFFWSEEHAREHRRTDGGVRGLYLTLDQGVPRTRHSQSAIFGFEGPGHHGS